MFGVPEAHKPHLVAQPGQIEGFGERLFGGIALRDRRKVLNGKRGQSHFAKMGEGALRFKRAFIGILRFI